MTLTRSSLSRCCTRQPRQAAAAMRVTSSPQDSSACSCALTSALTAADILAPAPTMQQRSACRNVSLSTAQARHVQ